MSLLHRYVFWSVLGAVTASIALFVFVLLAGNAIRDIIGLLAAGRLTWGVFIKLLILLIPYVAAYALPIGMLAGVLIVLGRLSAQQEITAMKAAGIPLYRLAAPILLVALLGVSLSILINGYYAPTVKTRYRETLSHIIQHNPAMFLQPKTFIHEFPGYVIYVGERNGNELRDFSIWELDQAQRVRVFIRARSGRFDFDPQESAILLTLSEGTAEKRDDDAPEAIEHNALLVLNFESLSIRLPLDRILGTFNKRRKLSLLTFPELLQARDEARKTLYTDPQEPTTQGAQKHLMRIQLQIQKNLSLAFSVLSLVLVGIPLGIKVSRKESYANIAIAFTFALIFYIFVALITWLEKYPSWRPDLLIWAPNLFFQIIGLLLFKCINRY